MDYEQSPIAQITAAVNHPASAPVPASPPKKELDPSKLAKLALEVAMNIRPLTEILPDFNLSIEEYESKIAPNPFFKSALETLGIEWNSANGTLKRLRLEAAAYLEENLPILAARMGQNGENLTAINDAAKTLAKIAGLDNGPATSNGSGEKFVINIDIGAGGQIRYEKERAPIAPQTEEASPIPIVIEGASNKEEVPELSTGERNIPAIQSIPARG